jgi:hypothetical protein
LRGLFNPAVNKPDTPHSFSTVLSPENGFVAFSCPPPMLKRLYFFPKEVHF